MTTSRKQPQHDTKESKGVNFSSLPKQQKTDMPEWINGPELQNYYPFTIYGATARKFRGDDKIDFAVAFKQDGEIQKKVLTLAANDERLQILSVVKREGAIKNCRLIRLPTGDMGYWKIIGADENVQDYLATASAGNLPLSSDDDLFD